MIVGPCGAVVAALGTGVGVLPGEVDTGVGVALGTSGALEVDGAPGFAGAVVPGVDEPPPPPHALSVMSTINVANALARRNVDCSNVWPLVQSAYGARGASNNDRSGDVRCDVRPRLARGEKQAGVASSKRHL